MYVVCLIQSDSNFKTFNSLKTVYETLGGTVSFYSSAVLTLWFSKLIDSYDYSVSYESNYISYIASKL